MAKKSVKKPVKKISIVQKIATVSYTQSTTNKGDVVRKHRGKSGRFISQKEYIKKIQTTNNFNLAVKEARIKHKLSRKDKISETKFKKILEKYENLPQSDKQIKKVFNLYSKGQKGDTKGIKRNKKGFVKEVNKKMLSVSNIRELAKMESDLNRKIKDAKTTDASRKFKKEKNFLSEFKWMLVQKRYEEMGWNKGEDMWFNF